MYVLDLTLKQFDVAFSNDQQNAYYMFVKYFDLYSFMICFYQ